MQCACPGRNAAQAKARLRRPPRAMAVMRCKPGIPVALLSGTGVPRLRRTACALHRVRDTRRAMPDIKFLTAAELLRLYRRRELSPVDVTRDQLDRIEKFQPT